MRKRFIGLGLFFIITIVQLYGQKLNSFVVVSSGEYFKSGEASVSWSLGEIATETYKSNVILSQGFQQAYDRNTSVEYLEEFKNVSIYPNPVRDKLNILIHEDFIQFGATLIDLDGRLLYRQDKLTGNNTRLDMSGYTSGGYILYLEYKDKKKSYLIYKF